MALFPCDYCSGRYKGAQQTLYPALVTNGTAIREKRRACPDCFDAKLAWCREYLSPADEGSQPVPEDCSIDGGELDGRIGVFVTVYARGADRADWYGQVCRSHLSKAGMALFGVQPSLAGLLAP
jgi:hypothetical protein